MKLRKPSQVFSIALLIVAATVTSCASESEVPTRTAAEAPPVVDPDQQYLTILDRFSVPQTTDDEMIEIGRLICNNLDLGMSKEAAGLPLYYSGTEFSLGEAGSIVGAAINAYCPQHKDW